MGFMDSYKHLEKFCNDLSDDNRGITAYINEMENTPKGPLCVKGWDEDLKKLKHYRWIRNKISHDPECNESNMCVPSDCVWLNNFYSRFLKQTDPLSLYRQYLSAERKAKRIRHNNQIAENPAAEKNQKHEKTKADKLGLIISVLMFLLIVTVLFFYLRNQ